MHARTPILRLRLRVYVKNIHDLRICVRAWYYFAMQYGISSSSLKYLVSALVFIVVGGVATLVFAQDTGGLVTCSGPDCNFCTFIDMVERVGNFIVGLLIIVSVMWLAWTGIEMAYLASGGSDAHQILKERMVNIVIGFVLIIAAWTIIDTVLKALVSDGDIRDNWRTPVGELCAAREVTAPNIQGVRGSQQ